MQIPDFSQSEGGTLRKPALLCVSEGKVKHLAGPVFEHSFTLRNVVGKADKLPPLPAYMHHHRTAIERARVAADDASAETWESSKLPLKRELNIERRFDIYTVMDGQADLFDEEEQDDRVPVITEALAEVRSCTLSVTKGKLVVEHTITIACAADLRPMLGSDILLQFYSLSDDVHGDKAGPDSNDDELPAEL